MASDAELPSRVARFEISSLLGEGGMGQVYLAWDPRLSREVALKVLTPAYAADTRALERFRREARVASGLNHPHICTIHDIPRNATSFTLTSSIPTDPKKKELDVCSGPEPLPTR